jgi:tetratricopeptide (TPR) repeat protein
MASYIASPARTEVFAASLLRMMDRCPDPAKLPVLIKALADSSPLVRSSAAAGLAGRSDPQVFRALADATADPYRVVRIQAAMALSRQSQDSLDPDLRRRLDAAFAEYENSMKCQPDDPRSHFNLGNYYQERGVLSAARAEYEIAVKQLPYFVPAYVNLSIVLARLGDTTRTEWALREALRHSPASAEANFNLGLLLAEQGRLADAEASLRAALKSDSNLAEAAYNLAVLVADKNLEETITLCRKAAALRPQEPKYAYTMAFYQHRKGDETDAIATLQPLVERQPPYADAIALLGSIYERTGKREAALRLYRLAAANQELPEQVRQQFTALLAAIQAR